MVSSRTDRAFLAALLVLNFVLKLSWLGVNELAHDEPFTVYWALRPMRELWAMLVTENNPPLYFVLMKVWGTLVPLDAAWWRVPSAIFSALAVWPLYLIGRHFGGTKTALVAALLFTLTNYHFGFAHEVRAYALFTLLAVWSMWLLIRDVGKAAGSRTTLILLAIANVLLVYTHFFGWLMIGVQALCVLLIPEYRQLGRTFLIALAAAVVSYIPYAPIFLGRMSQSVSQGTWLEVPVPEELYNMIWRWSNAPVLAVALLAVIMVATVRNKGSFPGLAIGLLWAIVPLLGMFMVSYFAPIFLDRYLVFAAPGFCLLGAAALNTVLPEGRLHWVPAAAVVTGIAFTFTPWQDSGLHPSRVVRQTKAWQDGSRSVLIEPGYYAPTYAWHLDRELLRDPGSLEIDLMERNVFLVNDPDRFVALRPEEDAVILVDAWSALTDPEQRTKQHLRSHWPTVDSVEADHKVWVFRFRP